MLISIILPAFNEQNNVETTVLQIAHTLKTANIQHEILLVDDGSHDLTSEKAGDAGAKIFRHTKNLGKGAAIRTGMKNATGELRFFVDADMSYDPTLIVKAVQCFQKTGADAVIGKRCAGVHGYPLFRKIASLSYRQFTRLIGLGNSDAQCGFKGFTSDSCQIILSLCKMNGFSFDTEMLYVMKKLNLNIAQLPVQPVHSNKSTVNIFRHGMGMICDLVKIIINDVKGEYTPRNKDGGIKIK